MKAPTVIIALSVVLAVVIATAISFDPFTNDQAEAMLRPDDPRVLAAGERIYADQCASCHGDRLQGQPDWRTRGADGLLPAPPHDAAGHTWHHPDEMLFRITKFGVASIVGDPSYKTSMPAYEGRLSDDEIIAVLSWIKARWPAQVRQKHDQMNAQAAKAARP
jgi:mono/diheme cytochrome c family protein